MARYGKKASEKVEKTMRERKRGTLRSGSTGKKVKSRKQAIAIGLAEARREGGKVPRKRTSTRATVEGGTRRSGAKRSGASRSGAKRSTAKRSGSSRASSARPARKK